MTSCQDRARLAFRRHIATAASRSPVIVIVTLTLLHLHGCTPPRHVERRTRSPWACPQTRCTPAKASHAQGITLHTCCLRFAQPPRCDNRRNSSTVGMGHPQAAGTYPSLERQAAEAPQEVSDSGSTRNIRFACLVNDRDTQAHK